MTTTERPTSITFQNAMQAAIFANECVGQFSDGAWENSGKEGDWKPWATAAVKVGENVGRDFYARKDNYNLHKLVEFVGDRMITYYKLALNLPSIVTQLVEADVRLPDGLGDFEATWHAEDAKKWEAAGLTKARFIESMALTVTEHDLKVQLTAMKKTMKIYRTTPVVAIESDEDKAMRLAGTIEREEKAANEAYDLMARFAGIND